MSPLMARIFQHCLGGKGVLKYALKEQDAFVL